MVGVIDLSKAALAVFGALAAARILAALDRFNDRITENDRLAKQKAERG